MLPSGPDLLRQRRCAEGVLRIARLNGEDA